MAKAKDRPAITPDMDVRLAAAMESSKQLLVPTITLAEEEAIPNLYAFMTPGIVNDPRYRGEGKPPRALREPTLFITWSRRSGGFQVSLTDKVLNLTGSLVVVSLLSALTDVEKELASGRFTWSQKKIT